MSNIVCMHENAKPELSLLWLSDVFAVRSHYLGVEDESDLQNFSSAVCMS